MEYKQRILAATIIGASLLLQACASGPVKDSQRDTSGKFDGNYRMNVQKMAGLQYVENWNMNCGGKAYSVPVTVKKGQAIIGLSVQGKKSFPTNIDDKGRFQLTIPLNKKASASGASATTMADGRRRLIVEGNLAKGSGSLVVGIKQFGWQGCRANVKYVKG